MRLKKLLIVLIGLIILSACSIQFYRGAIDETCHERIATSRNRNVCKHLKDSVVIYAIFVDVDQFHPWTEYDIASTLDSINKARNWILGKADSVGVNLKIDVVNHKQGSKLSFPEKRARVLPLNLNHLGSAKRKHTNNVENWTSGISKYAGRSVPKRSSSKVGTSLKVYNTERLIAALRDNYETDNIALMFFVNGYVEDYPSVTLNAEIDSRVEYSIITKKNPSIIAHEFLHLFGALDLYPNHNFPTFNYAELANRHPNELMRIQHKDIQKLSLSPISQYYIGWQDTLDLPNTRLLYHLNTVIEY